MAHIYAFAKTLVIQIKQNTGLKSRKTKKLFLAILCYFNIAFDAILKFNEESGPYLPCKLFSIQKELPPEG